jgi:hypothetical protein
VGGRGSVQEKITVTRAAQTAKDLTSDDALTEIYLRGCVTERHPLSLVDVHSWFGTKIGSDKVAFAAQKNLKKFEKKACHRAGPSVRRDAGQKACSSVQKNLKKKLARLRKVL